MTTKDLRTRAEAALTLGGVSRPHAELSDTRHELDVHQVELALQNEELERSRRELELATERYFRLFDLAPMSFIGIDRTGVIVELNAAATRLLGVERATGIGSPFARYVADRDVIRYHQFFRRAVEQRSKLGIELALSLPRARPRAGEAGRVIPVRAEILPLQGELEEEFLLSLVDLSELHAAEGSLEEEKLRVAAIFDAAVDGIVTIDKEGVVRDFNPAAEVMFGLAAGEIVGNKLDSVISLLRPQLEASAERDAEAAPAKDDRAGTEAAAVSEATVFEGMLGRPRELVARRADGTEFPVHVSLARLGATGYCGFIRDLTEVKKVEERLRHAQKMEAVGTLASGIAHDFNNLLMGITGCAEIAAESVPEDSAARLFLKEITDATSSGTEVVRQLLAFGRREDELVHSVFELNDFVETQANMIRRLVGADLDVRISLDAESSRVRIDPSQLVQVLMNLAVNARDASAIGATLEISTASKTVSHDDGDLKAGQYVALTIRDHGSGMSAAVRKRAFEPFFTTKDVGKGTGLGLSTVYGIVHQAGGHILLSSAEGMGTTFEVLFPLSDDEITQNFRPSEEGKATGGNETILLVEDDPRVRLVMRNYLERGGYHVLDAADGPTAIECCAKYPKPIHLLLTDMVLPKMNGDRIAAEVSALKPETRVVFVSAHDTHWLKAHGNIAADAQFLQKPIVATDLLRAVRAVLDGQALQEVAGGQFESEGPEGQSASIDDSLGTVLVVENSEPARTAIEEVLRLEGWNVLSASSGEEAMAVSGRCGERVEILLTEARLPDLAGDELARRMGERDPDLRVVYLSPAPATEFSPRGPILSTPLDLQQLAETLAVVKLAPR